MESGAVATGRQSEEHDNMAVALRFDLIFLYCAFAVVGAALIGLL
jgi:hypothetical protein